MPAVVMAMNKSSNGHSRMEMDDMEEDHKDEECTKELESDDTITDNLSKTLLKIGQEQDPKTMRG
jgi:hypothetical protein